MQAFAHGRSCLRTLHLLHFIFIYLVLTVTPG